MHEGHCHKHDHDHDCCHHHGHEEGCCGDLERAKAKLKYMSAHNGQHLEELKEAAEAFDGETRALLDEAVRCSEQANELVAKACKKLEAE